MNNFLISIFSIILLIVSNKENFAQTTRTFSATDTWPAPAGVTSVKVECWGGGRNGASLTSTGGNVRGGGGAYALGNAVTVTPGTTYTATVGTAGGNSSFSSIVAAGGGNVTVGNQTGAPGGSTGSAGDVVYNGGNGADGQGNSSGGGGSSAGTSATGNNAVKETGGVAPAGGGNGANGVGSGLAGLAGFPPGGGGSGARGNNQTLAGGAGGNGQVIISYPCTHPINPTGNDLTVYFDHNPHSASATAPSGTSIKWYTTATGLTTTTAPTGTNAGTYQAWAASVNNAADGLGNVCESTTRVLVTLTIEADLPVTWLNFDGYSLINANQGLKSVLFDLFRDA